MAHWRQCQMRQNNNWNKPHHFSVEAAAKQITDRRTQQMFEAIGESDTSYQLLPKFSIRLNNNVTCIQFMVIMCLTLERRAEKCTKCVHFACKFLFGRCGSVWLNGYSMKSWYIKKISMNANLSGFVPMFTTLLSGGLHDTHCVAMLRPYTHFTSLMTMQWTSWSTSQLCCAECIQWSIISSLSMQFDWWNVVPLHSVILIIYLHFIDFIRNVVACFLCPYSGGVLFWLASTWNRDLPELAGANNSLTRNIRLHGKIAITHEATWQWAMIFHIFWELSIAYQAFPMAIHILSTIFRIWIPSLQLIWKTKLQMLCAWMNLSLRMFHWHCSRIISNLKWWIKNKSNQLPRINVCVVFILTVVFSSGWLSIFRDIACVTVSMSMPFYAICTLNCRFRPAAFDKHIGGTQSNTIGFHILCPRFFPIMNLIAQSNTGSM